MYHFITLSNGKKVQAVFEAVENETTGNATKFDFKELSNGKKVQKIVFVDADGNQIKTTE